MRDSKYIYVDVPYTNKIAYSLYADGFSIQNPVVSENREYITFTYPKKSVFILYYEFFTPFKRKTRRAYIVTGYRTSALNKGISLPGVSERVEVIFQARGHKVDDIERLKKILIEGQNENILFKFPLIFWYKLSAMINYQKGKRIDALRLFNQYKPDYIKEINIYDNIKRASEKRKTGMH